MTNRIRYSLLRLTLLASFLGWGVAAVVIVVPLDVVRPWLIGLGATDIPADQMLDYWMRMACGAFTMIGVLNLVFFFNPEKYSSSIRVLGLLSIAEGIVLLAHGVRLGLAPMPFYFDTAFCLGTGVLLFICAGKDSGK